MSDKQTVTVAVDSREPLDELLPLLIDHDEVEEFEVDTLESGDLAIEGVGFERKTPSDYATSITDDDDHLRGQVERMGDQYDHAYVLLEGDMSDFDFLSHTRMKPTSLRGFAASLTAREGIPVIPCSNTENLIDYAVRQARKHIEDPSASSLRTKTTADSTAPVVKRMYGCIDGVGADTASKLHLQFPSLQDALDADESDFEGIEGIGPKTAQKIHEALHDAEMGVQETTI